MKRLGLVLDPIFERHDTGAGHPERPARLRRLREVFAERDLPGAARTIAPAEAGDALLTLVHDPAYVRHVETACAAGPGLLDAADTAVGPESPRIARLAVGSLAALCREVVEGRLDAGFAAVRPPGHHAERDRAMGFCLFNNVAVAAAALRKRHGVARVLIVDWDVHHGNGTQHIFEDDPAVFYYSSHQMPLYPGTGYAHERGTGAGLGATLNVPLSAGDGDGPFLAGLTERLAPEMERFRPEFVLVSAGFDAHRSDPLGGLAVTTDAFDQATRIVLAIAARHAGGRIVSVLEGGYDLDGLADAAAAHVEALSEGGGSSPPASPGHPPR